MYKYNKRTHQFSVFCPNCEKDIMFFIPKALFHKDRVEYPFTFRFIHGNFPHSISLYIDVNDDIRSYEFGDSVQLSEEYVDKIIQDNVLEQEKASAIILQSIFDTYSTLIQAKIPDANQINLNIEKNLDSQFESLFKSQDHGKWGDKIINILKKNEFFIISDNKGDIFKYNSITKKRIKLNNPIKKNLSLEKKWIRTVSKDGNVGFESKNIYVGKQYSRKSVLIKHIGPKFVVFFKSKVIKEQDVNKTVNKGKSHISINKLGMI